MTGQSNLNYLANQFDAKQNHFQCYVQPLARIAKLEHSKFMKISSQTWWSKFANEWNRIRMQFNENQTNCPMLINQLFYELEQYHNFN